MQIPWASPAFLEGGGGQDRAWGRHLTAANTLSAFSRFNQWEGEGGGAVSFWADSTTGGWGAVRIRSIQPVGGGAIQSRRAPLGTPMDPAFTKEVKMREQNLNLITSECHREAVFKCSRHGRLGVDAMLSDQTKKTHLSEDIRS